MIRRIRIGPSVSARNSPTHRTRLAPEVGTTCAQPDSYPHHRERRIQPTARNEVTQVDAQAEAQLAEQSWKPARQFVRATKRAPPGGGKQDGGTRPSPPHREPARDPRSASPY